MTTGITKRTTLVGAMAATWGVFLTSLTGAPAARAQAPEDRRARQVRQHLLRGARPGVLVLRAWPGAAEEARARSWSGGLPRMPADLAWPIRAKTGRPMSFLAQIDLSDLPATARAQGLPAAGVLWFFTALDDTIEAEQVAVLYRPDTGPWPERTAPANLDFLSGEAPYSLFPEGDPLASIAVRQAMSFRAVDTYADDLPEAMWDIEDLEELLWSVHRAALVRALGERPAPPTVDHYSWKTLGSADWPPAGLFAELGARAAFEALPSKSVYAKPDPERTAEEQALHQALMSDAEARVEHWRARRFEPLTASERQDFQAWLRGFMTRAAALKRGRLGDRSPPTAFDFTYPIEKTPMFAAYHVLAHGGPAVATLPAPLRQPRVWAPDNAPDDQMLGHGSSAQDGPYRNRDNVLLLQIAGDDDKPWLGDGMMLHFWITPQDLAARRFDRVFPTYEGD